MFEQTFKNIDDILWKDAGCSTELDYAEQSSWILFLKWLDDYEKDKETKAKLENKKFKQISGKSGDSYNIRETGKFLSDLINELKIKYEIKE